MSLIHYATPAIAAASSDVSAVAARTEDNHQRSLRVVASNAENYGGQGSQAFQSTIAEINGRYARAQDKIRMTGVTLQQINDSMTEQDARCAGQY